jgi:hypothetical protein
MRTAVLVILCAILIAGSFLWVRTGPQLAGSPVAVHIVGVTNDAAGVRHATLAVTNQGRYPVLLWPAYNLEITSGTWRSNGVPKWAKTVGTNLVGVLPGTGTRLNRRECHHVSVVLPFDDQRWRASFRYWEILPPWQAAYRHGLAAASIRRTNAAVVPRDVYSQWADQTSR